jgi:putative ABC transport system permease protein
MNKTDQIPDQIRIPWGTAVSISWTGLKRRLFRSLITISGVVLAIAFLSYMTINEALLGALVRINDPILNASLQQHGVDVFTAGSVDPMLRLLIGLALLTSTVGILNAMLMSVTERIKEIGTLKCLGASDPFIVKAYLIESAMQGGVGSLVGVTTGSLVAIAVSLFNYHGHVFTAFPWGAVGRAMAVAFCCGVVITVIAAIAPAWTAARKQPVDALRIDE